MKILLTGATGWIGSAVLQQLLAATIDVCAMGRTRPDSIAPADFIAVDLLSPPADLSAQLAAHQPTHLLHLAWDVTPGKFWHSPLNDAWREATITLARAFCEAGGKHICGAGSCAEYAPNEDLSDEHITALAPPTRYGEAKLAAWRATESIAARYGVRAAWARIFLLYGAGEHPARLIPSLIAVMRGERAPFGIHAASQRDWLAREDVAAGLIHLTTHGAEGAYNLCSAQLTSNEKLVRLVADLCDADADAVLRLPPPAGHDLPVLGGENQRLCALGWSPRLSLEAGLAQLLKTPLSHSRKGGCE